MQVFAQAIGLGLVIGPGLCLMGQISALSQFHLDGVQPFGGEGLSGTGPKAGGPHYMLRFGTERVVTVDVTAQGGDPELLSL